ncbi:MAG: hypothetical protein ACRC4N_16235 [Gammaproteobacteria bacterium]
MLTKLAAARDRRLDGVEVLAATAAAYGDEDVPEAFRQNGDEQQVRDESTMMKMTATRTRCQRVRRNRRKFKTWPPVKNLQIPQGENERE